VKNENIHRKKNISNRNERKWRMKLISLEEKNKNIESEAKGKEYVEEAEK
jgi:hypothetical protein